MKTQSSVQFVDVQAVAAPARSMLSSWRHTAVALMATVALVGCGSSVKLDESAAVSDARAVPAQSAGAAASGADSRGVANVQAGAQQIGQPPANLSRLVFFDFDDFTVKPEFMPVLEGHARFLSADRQRRVVLEGHTDERGGREYNLALGQKRADAVRRSLVLLGVNEAQLESVSFGKEKPANTGSDEEAHRQNRRVELSYR